MTFLDYLYGGAWPFLVRGVVCQVDSDNERDLALLNSCQYSACYFIRSLSECYSVVAYIVFH